MRHRVRAAIARCRELFRPRSRVADEQEDEFAFHIDMEAAENVRRGMNATAARRAALLRFGGRQRFREATNDARGVVALDNLLRDARFAVRRLSRARLFAVGVIATLGIGIGAAVGIGTIVYDVLLRDLPYDDPGQLVRVGFITDGLGVAGDMNSPASYFHFAKSARSFAALGAYAVSDAFAITDGDAPQGVTIASMTPSMFTVLRVRPLLGRLFEPGDSSFSNKRIAILISENLWRTRYGADPSIVGRIIDIDHGRRRIVGVLPSSFAFPTPAIDIYYPAPVPVSQPQISVRGLNVIGRLRPGVDPRAAQAELTALLPRLSTRFPAITPEILRRSRARVAVTPLKAAVVAPVRPQLVLLGMLVAVVLLIAVTNVINLFVLRSERTAHEIAIALSLGATRIALAQRIVIEGIALGLAAALVALPTAALALLTKFGFTEREIPRLHEVAFTWRTPVLVFACAVALGGFVGLVAFSRTPFDRLADRLRSSRSTPSRAWRRAQAGLVAFQVAIALVLLVAAGLLGRSFWNLHEANVGFDPTNAMTFQVSLPWNGYTSYAAEAAFHANVVDRLRSLPGVMTAAVALRLPLAGFGGSSLALDLQSADGTRRTSVSAIGNMANADYFAAMRIALVAGRTFRSGDLRGTPAVIVSEQLAKAVFGVTDVVGREIEEIISGRPTMQFTIVGVVGDVQLTRIEDGPAPMLYFPLQRDGDGLPPDAHPIPGRPMDVQYVIRGPRLPSASTIQAILTSLDRRIPATNIRRLRSLVDDATARVRLTMLLIAVAGAAALLLGVIGVYSVVAYAANRRAREFAIRIALGAAPARVGRMVVVDGFRIVTVGTIAGLGLALGATRFLRALLYEVEPHDLAGFASATVLLVVVTLCATLIPAWRAARTNPEMILRGE
ncbi:MAG TPA: ADOP family duplicated permease [Gemmatimonadaceae bacterium]|nr:ADOP family duplicated permease [Gemmatimonadaceae bacterium]